MKCKTCNGAGRIKHHHDAGDHFGAGTSPYSGWKIIPCPDCLKKANRISISDEERKSVQAAIDYADSLDW